MGKQTAKQILRVVRDTRTDRSRAQWLDRNKYPLPHQGKQECERRREKL